MSFEKDLKEFPFIETRKLGRVAVICHRNADADTYLSAYAVSKLLRSLAPGCKVDVITPGGMTVLTKKLSSKFPQETSEGDTGEKYDLFVAVDVGDIELLNEWKGRLEKAEGFRVLVDHHPMRDVKIYDRAIVDESATSAAEVVYALYRAKGMVPDAQASQALLEALLFDSSHLAIASPGGVRAAAALLDLGADLPAARKELRSEPDYGEVLAKLKGAQRTVIYKAGDWLVASTLVGSFQAHVARSLIYLGADVAVVSGESDGETRVSLRATQRFLETTGVKLGTQVAEEMARKLGGHGGGHSTAASFSTGVGEEEAMEATLVRLGELVGALKKLD
ncbi:MAG: DHH family phosphoesterase [Nitrososphaerota archaeon]|nr:DHH family phosphoesterase [Nitrososphaerota archaeon]